MAVSAPTTPSSPGLNSGTTDKCTERRFRASSNSEASIVHSMSSVQERQHEGRTLRMMVWIPIVALRRCRLPGRHPKSRLVSAGRPHGAIRGGLHGPHGGAARDLAPGSTDRDPAEAGAARRRCSGIVLGVLSLFCDWAADFPGRSSRHDRCGQSLLAAFRLEAVIAQISAAVVVVALLLGGFEVTARLIPCPAGGTSEGSWSGILTAALRGGATTRS